MNRTDTVQREPSTLRGGRPLVLALGLGHILPAELHAFSIREATSFEDVLNSLEQENLGVVVLGPFVKPTMVRAILERTDTQLHGPLAILVGVTEDPEFFQQFVDNGRVFYISRGSLSPGQMRSVVAAAMDRYESALARKPGNVPSSRLRIEGALEYCIRLLNQTDLASLSRLFVEAARNVVGADRAQCLVYDEENETLSSVDGVARQEGLDSAASGFVAFVARTGQRLRLEGVGADPRYDPQADNPGGAADDRLLAVPIFGATGVPVAVLTAIRSGDAPTFSSDDDGIFDLLVECMGPTITAIVLQQRIERLLVPQTQSADVFRREALDHYTRALDSEGDLLQTSPSWLKRTYWLTVALLLTSLVFMLVARVEERATGVAVVRARSKTTVAATSSGLVRSVEVSGGDHVRRGDLLLRFEDLTGATALDRLREQLRAPRDGVVGDLRVRPGQQLAPGDQVASIVDEDAGYELIILLPGQYAAQVRRGMHGVLKVDGYPDSHQAITVDDVGSEIMGPREAQRYAGTADALTITGPLVAAHSSLSASRFSAGEGSYAYRDGMTARAEVNLRSEPMIMSLLPGLKEFLRELN